MLRENTITATLGTHDKCPTTTFNIYVHTNSFALGSEGDSHSPRQICIGALEIGSCAFPRWAVLLSRESSCFSYHIHVPDW